MTGSERQLLLLSSSRTPKQPEWLEYADDCFAQFLGGKKRAAFIPYALNNHESFTQQAQDYFQKFGLSLTSIDDIPRLSNERYLDAIIVGGGNSFRLLKKISEGNEGLLDYFLKDAVESGIPYIGWSAGANLACPTIRTTNDMPIVQPRSLKALNLVPFQINPHYIDPDPNPQHMGETREQRINEFHEENTTPVIGLREGAILRVVNDLVTLEGTSGARIFKRGQEPTEHLPGAKWDVDLEAA